MTLWHPPQARRSDLPLFPVWRALGRYNYGALHFHDGREWVLQVERIVRRSDGWYRVQVGEWRDPDEIDAIIAALPSLPGVGVRLALLHLLMELVP